MSNRCAERGAQPQRCSATGAVAVIAVAPMMDWTDRHCRVFHRTLSRHALLYTEMVTTGALIHGPRERLLETGPVAGPVALQLGGSDPAELARCARWGEAAGYDEINLNVGCPSDRVQNGRFGACLMREPALVADCVARMRAEVDVPVTVKSRIGVDELEDEQWLGAFARGLAEAGCARLIVHARKAWLQGLSPKENREVPPLRYDWVYRLRRAVPGLAVWLNGGVQDLDAAAEHLRWVDGVMIGRAAYQNPYLLSGVDARFHGSNARPSRAEVVSAMAAYLTAEGRRGTRAQAVVRHMLGLYQGEPGARRWRRYLSEQGPRRVACSSLLEEAAAHLGSGTARSPGASPAETA